MSTTIPATRPKSQPPPSVIAPKRKRGGQPGNSNARKDGAYSIKKPGPLFQIRLTTQKLQHSLIRGGKSPLQVYKLAVLEFEKIQALKEKQNLGILSTVRAEIRLIKLMFSVKSAFTPLILKERALEEIAANPFGWIEDHFKASGISRDADSFFPVSKLSARNSLDSASLPSQNMEDLGRGRGGAELSPLQGGDGGGSRSYATDLTDEQWAIVEPLIPPDPHMDWQSGQPPVIIAASRWGFSAYTPSGEFSDFAITQEHNQILRRFPTLSAPPKAQPGKKRGRPRKPPVSPRLLLNAIFWKLATGHNWDALPPEFPPMRLCRKYYRRLFMSGRLYTILRALYNHLRLEAVVDICELLEQGLFTTTPSQHIALNPQTPPTWQNYTALLFMQLARDAYLHFQRQKKHDNPAYTYIPVLKGGSQLSTARLPDDGNSASPIPSFEPLEWSSSTKKWKQNQKRENCIKTSVRVSRASKGKSPPSAGVSASHHACRDSNEVDRSSTTKRPRQRSTDEPSSPSE